MIKEFLIVLSTCLLLLNNTNQSQEATKPISFSGIYPHLAYYNFEGECGTGAVVPWADRLWVITYGPHLPFGSSDKLYEITPNLLQTVRDESIGGTPANRMIHAESDQLFIGPYCIDKNRVVRTIQSKDMPGRLTGNARHLFSPTGKIYFATMEEGFYEVDVKNLEVNMLFKDGNVDRKPGEMAQHAELLPGAHGKGLYSGQGVLVYSNNGEANAQALEQFNVEAGVLAEWDGKDWKIIRRCQFVEVTGPGGIYGNKNPEKDPIWATGWDHRSVIVAVRDLGKWTFFRLPKASHSYDGAHGWNTEWPRIRDIGIPEKPDYLMTMHGLFWKFPETFSSQNTGGIRPRSAYLKVIGDFARWNNQLVFGCDDSAQKEFLNKRKVKGSIEGPGQSHSNLWFTSLTKPDELGTNTAEGAVWLQDEVRANEVSEPFLFAGWTKRCVWIKNTGKQTTTLTFEADAVGKNDWKRLKSVKIKPNQSESVEFNSDESGEWIRVKSSQTTQLTVHFFYTGSENRSQSLDPIFNGIAKIADENVNGSLLYGLGNNRRALGISAKSFTGNKVIDNGYYELDSEMKLVKKDDKATIQFINEKFAIPKEVIKIEESSVLIIDDKGRRWRLPLGNNGFTEATNAGNLRICREVSTERDLFNCMGTFYELPAENADGFAKIRPVTSHNLFIHDYASFRGMLIMTGINNISAINNPHIVISEDGKASVWAGVIDDLWKMGKPVGKGGPWKNAQVKAMEASDSYLIGFYDKKKLALSHNLKDYVKFSVEVEPIGHGPWMLFKEFEVKPGDTFNYEFPESFQARWIRFRTDKSCEATAWLDYN